MTSNLRNIECVHTSAPSWATLGMHAALTLYGWEGENKLVLPLPAAF